MKTLILNADYKPLSIIDIRRAVVLEKVNPNITALSHYSDKNIKSVTGHVRIPAVMVYSKYIHVVRKKSPSKRAIRIRDKNKCVYCNLLLDVDSFTIDHIIPVSRFKNRTRANTWENKISCCKKCNLKKGNRTPEEANMKMFFQPRRMDLILMIEDIPAEWNDYI